ncbi:alpha-1,2-mannosyltransferase [Nakamurella sp. UYEF19]|uniref:glycosyltransferase 87 family protein n=1 Tax=Nakamurella sp. UYEF19 TaxID=1756392 RepID=UPI003392AE18
MRTVIELASIRSLRAWANLDLRRLAVRDRLVVIGAGIACLFVAFFAAYSVYRQFGAPRNEYDLRIYYNALTSWRGGSGLYEWTQYDPINGLLGFTYPPAAAILLSPITSLSVQPMIGLWSFAILLSVIGFVLLALRERVHLRQPQMALATGLAVAAAFCLQPISQTAAYGQVNTFLGLLVMVDVFVLSRRGSRWAGIGIGLAMAIKLTPAIFLLYLVLSGQWRMLRIAIATAVSATLVAAVLAPSATWQYFTSLLWDSSRIGKVDNTANQSINGTLARITAPLPPDKLAWILCAVLVVLVGIRRIRRAVAAGDTLLAVTVTGLLGVLISPISWVHHAIWIFPAMVLLIARLVTTFPAAALGVVARRLSSFSRLSADDRAAVRRWLGLTTLAVTGLLVFVMNTRNLFGLPDTGYGDLAWPAVIAGSVQTIWMLTAVAVMPAHGAHVRTIARDSSTAAHSTPGR